MAIESLITDHLDLWTSAVRPKSSAGRSSNSKLELTGIKKLRELILELAVRGKLVPQDPSDEPASVLLERISAEKVRLVKEGKIKKPKALAEIGEEEKPFELPEGWEWCRLDELSLASEAGWSPQCDNTPRKNEQWGVLKVSAVTWGKFLAEENKALPEPLEPKSEYEVLPGDFLISRANTAELVARAVIAPADTPCKLMMSDKIIRFRFSHFVNSSYICLANGSCTSREYYSRVAGGTSSSMKNVSRFQIQNLVIALPPLSEQKRILDNCEKLMALCDQLEQCSESQLAAHQTLVEALLATLTDSTDADELAQNWARLSTHFDTLFTTEASIDALKQTILQLAVMGKLVPQDPNDEPASELFNRLVSERDAWLKEEAKENGEAMTMLRKLKKLTVPKAPFELPKAWACVHLIQLSKMLVDCHNKTAPYVEVGIPIIRTTNIRERQFIERELKFVSQETYEYWSRRCPPEQGDIIFTREAPMGEALIIPVGEKWCLGQRTMLIRPMHEFVSNQFLLLALTEPHLLERASEHAVGLTVKHLRVGDVENLNIPLPPLEEQHRIVAKVDELMALCDQLKSRLQISQQTQLALAESLVEGALA
ncbi:restriction endonuclease subunit S [Aeromonas hydrophila]|uniref:restriction endonuclease subunit S n=1 Tax=Aeromonas hydrophila TaxID=644 RepID=UPI00191F601A|nr:restriction endonuclease subunit S [Aeromonas hydrophila]MBL0572663.1 restriction endonuclease subunit S [Aeromonas hydrophila]